MYTVLLEHKVKQYCFAKSFKNQYHLRMFMNKAKHSKTLKVITMYKK